MPFIADPSVQDAQAQPSGNFIPDSSNIVQPLKKRKLIASATGKGSREPTTVTKDDALEFARPFVGDAAMTAGTALSAPVLGPVAPAGGVALAGISDYILQHLQKNPPQGIVSQAANLQPGGIPSSVANTGEMLLGNKFFSGLTNKIGRGISNLRSSAGVDPQLAELKPTLSQYLDPSTYSGRIAKFVEDTFGRSGKEAAIKNSADIGFGLGKSDAASLAQRPQSIIESPELHAQFLQKEAIANQDKLKGAFNQFGTQQKFYGPQYKDVTTGYDSFGNPITSKLNFNKNFDATKYAEATRNAHAVATLHDSLFDEKGLKGLVDDSNNTAVPFIDQILKDPQKLDRAIKSSSLPIPGTKNVTSPQLKNDLQAYYLNKTIDGASTRDPLSGKIKSIDPQSIIDQFADPSMTESVKSLYTSQQRSDITQLFKNLAMTQQKMNAGFSTASKVFWAADALSIAPALFEGGFKAAAYPLGIAGMRVGGAGIAKLMTNPTIARSLVAASSGMPLRMSQQAIAKEIGKALNGVTIDLIGRDGKRIPGQIKDGDFVPSGDGSQ